MCPFYLIDAHMLNFMKGIQSQPLECPLHSTNCSGYHHRIHKVFRVGTKKHLSTEATSWKLQWAS